MSEKSAYTKRKEQRKIAQAQLRKALRNYKLVDKLESDEVIIQGNCLIDKERKLKIDSKEKISIS
jgi:hypothetical protein